MEGAMSLESLPADVLIKVANRLPRRDAVQLSRCSKSMYRSLSKWIQFIGSRGDENVERSVQLVGRSVLSFGPCAVSADGTVTAVIVRELLGTFLYRIETDSKEEASSALDLDQQFHNCVEVSYSGRTVAVSGGESGLVRVFTDAELLVSTSIVIGEPVAFVRICPQERYLCVALRNRPELRLYDLEGNLLQEVQLGRRAVVPLWYQVDFTLEGGLTCTLGTTSSDKVTNVRLEVDEGVATPAKVASGEHFRYTRLQNFELFAVSNDDVDAGRYRKLTRRDVSSANLLEIGSPHFFCNEDGDMVRPSDVNASRSAQLRGSRWLGFGAVSRRGPWTVKFTLDSDVETRPDQRRWCGLAVSVCQLGDN